MLRTPRPPVRQRSPAAANRADIHRILDAGRVAHVAFAVRAQPFVIPMLYARDGDVLLLQGSVERRLRFAVGSGAQACVSVALVDGLVLARSHLQHAMNHRSVVAFGRVSLLDDPREKVAALACLVDTLVPGRAGEARPATPQELSAIAVLRFQIDEATATFRNGPPADPAEDLDLPYWAGELPLRAGYEPVRPSPDLAPDRPLPHSLRQLIASAAVPAA